MCDTREVRACVDKVDLMIPGCDGSRLHELVRIVLGRSAPAPIVEERRRELSGFRAQVSHLLATDRGIEQRTEEWYEARRHMFTASELQELLGNPAAIRGLVEKKLSGATNSLSGVKAIQWGVTYEPVACALYEHRNGVKVNEFGLLKHPRIERFGASPDGITDQGIMLEIKCPYSRRIDGRISKAYMTQMQTQLDTAELKECDFLECKIYEYADEEEYLSDVFHNDAGLASNGMEKGVVFGDQVVIESAGEAVRRYREIMEETKEAREQEEDEKPGSAPKLWRIDVYHCQRVYKDPAFMPSIERLVRDSAAKLDKAEREGIDAVEFPPPPPPKDDFPFIGV